MQNIFEIILEIERLLNHASPVLPSAHNSNPTSNPTSNPRLLNHASHVIPRRPNILGREGTSNSISEEVSEP